MLRLLREPLIHFLALGALLFAVYRFTGGGTGGAVEPSRQIQLSLEDLSQLELGFESQWLRPPTPEELESLIENRIHEEVLYREALALGLDRDDTIVRRRMAQKLGFLAEDVASAHEPSSEELRTWYAANTAQFALPARVSFRHLYFSPDKRGSRARADAVAALAQVSGEPQDAKRAAALGDPFMFQDYYGDRAPEQLAKEFGPKFAQAIAALAPGAWQGPIESGYGWHLVFVDTRVPGRVPEFEEVEPDVKIAWLAAAKERARAQAYAAMRAKYTVLLPAPPAAPSASAPSPSRDAADSVPPL
jgi:peptidyl-prolyl cis-trans isomerase C